MSASTQLQVIPCGDLSSGTRVFMSRLYYVGQWHPSAKLRALADANPNSHLLWALSKGGKRLVCCTVPMGDLDTFEKGLYPGEPIKLSVTGRVLA